jgi:hypothetical protein
MHWNVFDRYTHGGLSLSPRLDAMNLFLGGMGMVRRISTTDGFVASGDHRTSRCDPRH